MGRCVAKLAEDKYVEWSSVVDAPVTCILTRSQMKMHLTMRYGCNQIYDAEAKLLQADKIGTSRQLMTLAELIEANRAGEDEEELTLEEIIKTYTEDGIQPDVD